ncbi:MAG: hypothetical protein IJY65_04440 [Clostridia bacterium]|nr:hypothetical protein [Clostridia bacterium]
MDKKLYVSYEEFGAVGDGVTDDMPAIVACHRYANENRLPVKVRDGAEYYIGRRDLFAEIKTDVDFGSAKFTIDDRELENYDRDVFYLVSESGAYAPSISYFSAKDKRIDFQHEGLVYLRIESDERKVFIRKGLNENAGTNLHDCFVADADGNILTDIDWDYERISFAEARSADDPPITVKGGVFTTIANRWESKYVYHRRGICIERSNATVEGVTHYVTGELDHGAPYRSFIMVRYCNNATVKDCLLTPHFTYHTESESHLGKAVSMGSYDLSFESAIGTRVINVQQSIDIMDTRYWGLMGSNFCKDMYFENCVISRFDAHQGVTNATIRGCTFGHMSLRLIGKGRFYIENSRVYGPYLISFRADYGGLWDGTATVKDCEWVPRKSSGCIIHASNDGDHYFGYVATQPKRIVLDGVRILDKNEYAEGNDKKYYVLSTYDRSYKPGKPYAYVPVKNLIYKNITSERGLEIALTKEPEQYPNLEVIYEK